MDALDALKEDHDYLTAGGVFPQELIDHPEMNGVQLGKAVTDTYLETSATAIFTYCLAHGVNKGWLDAKVYGPVALLGWHAVASAVNAQGQVEGVCVGTGMGFDAAFYAYRPVHQMAAHGYGVTLWAGAEIIRLLRHQHPKTNDSAVQFYEEEVPTVQPIFNYDGQIRF